MPSSRDVERQQPRQLPARGNLVCFVLVGWPGIRRGAQGRHDELVHRCILRGQHNAQPVRLGCEAHELSAVAGEDGVQRARRLRRQALDHGVPAAVPDGQHIDDHRHLAFLPLVLDDLSALHARGDELAHERVILDGDTVDQPVDGLAVEHPRLDELAELRHEQVLLGRQLPAADGVARGRRAQHAANLPLFSGHVISCVKSTACWQPSTRSPA